MPVTPENVHDVVQYHAPDEDQIASIGIIRWRAEEMIRDIVNHCPACGDQQAAIRHVREAMMTANAAIVLKGMV